MRPSKKFSLQRMHADADREKDGVGERKLVRVVHVFTVPLSLGFLRGQAAFMRERGYSLSVVCSPGPGLDRFSSEEQVEAHAIRLSRQITPIGDLQALRNLVALLRRLRPDIVHAHTPK